MPIVHRNRCNEELKRFLKINHITYSDLAEVSGYSKGTIDQWLIRPLSEHQIGIIKQSIDMLMKKHQPPTIPASSCNYSLRVRISEQGISYADLSRLLGVRPQTVREWIISRELSPQRREQLEIAIEQIGEERRLSNED